MRQIADDGFAEKYHAGWKYKALSQHYKCGAQVVCDLVRALKLPPRGNVSEMNDAPTLEEEQASAASLALAPLVAERVKEVTALHLKFLRGEITSFPWDRTPNRRCLFVSGKMRGD